MKKTILLALIACWCISCKSDTVVTENSKNDFFVIKKGDSSSDFNFKPESIEFIFLQEDRAQLSSILNLLQYKDKFIIRSKNRNAIYIFKENGELENIISPSGNGPLEFSELSTLEIVDNNKLVISDNSNQKLLIYDLLADKMIKDIKIDYPVFAMKSHNNQLVMLANDIMEGNLKVVSNLDFDAIRSFQHGGEIANLVVSLDPFEIIDNSIYVNIGFSDTVFRYENEHFKTVAVLGENKSSMTSLESSYLKDKIMSRVLDEELQGMLIPQGTFSTYGDNWVFPMFWASDFLLFNTKTKESKFINYKAAESIRGYTHGYYPRSFLNKNGYDYAFIMPDEKVLKYVEPLHKNGSITDDDYQLLLDYIEEGNENPIITKYRYKSSFPY